MIVRSHLIPFDPIHLISCWASGTCRWSRQLWQWHRLYPTGSSTSRHHVIHEFFQGGGRAEGWQHLSRYYGPDLYDINWLIPLHEATLEYDSVKLTPFIPSLTLDCGSRLRRSSQIPSKSPPLVPIQPLDAR